MRTQDRLDQQGLHDELERWRGVGLIDTATEEAIERFEAKQEHPSAGAIAEPARRIPVIAEAIAYLGAALAAAALMTVAIDQWETWSDWTRVAVVGVGAVAAFGIGLLTGGSEEPAIERLSVVMWAIATAGTGFTTGLFASEVLGWRDADAVTLAGAAAFAVGGGLYLIRRHGLQQLAMFGGLVAMTMSYFTDWAGRRGQVAGGTALFVLGAAWFLLGLFDIVTPGRMARIVGAIAAVTSVQVIYDGTAGWEWAMLVGAILAMAVVGMSIPLEQPELTFIGAIWTFQYLLIWVNESFAGTLGVPIALAVAGAIALGASLVLTRRMRR